MTADLILLTPDDEPDNGWQDFFDPCPEHGRACGPWCDVLWGHPMSGPNEQMIRRAVDIGRRGGGCGWWEMGMRDFYEPWKPRRGQRVEIHPSPECQVQGSPDSPQKSLGTERGHQGWETGLTGRVIQTKATAQFLADQGHRFLVQWDAPRWVGDRRVFGASYAAAELVPATPSTAGSGDGRADP